MRVVDHFRELVHPSFERASRAVFHALLRRTPGLWGVLYALGDLMASDSPFTLGVTRLGSHRLARLLADFAPDAVVTVHATPAVALSALAAEGRRVPPHTTVVTDFVAHGQWIVRHVDRYCVATEEVRHELIARGVAADRIVATGVPVRAAFDEPLDRGAARAALGLSPAAPVVLAMAGSEGSFGRLGDVARALLATERAVQGVIVAGRDRSLRAALEQLVPRGALRVFGWVDDVRTLMAAADLLVTKAGGMTLAEAIAAGLPLLCYGSLPGQERWNERFARRAGIALVARSRRELATAFERALADPALLAALRERLGRLHRPWAARRVVHAVLERGVRRAA